MEILKNVSLDEILLWENNPRVEQAKDQKDEVEKIYNFSNKSQSVSKRQFINLAESIATKGYQNEIEPILTLKEGGQYVVQDANRRISAIKLLNNPDMYKEILDDDDFTRIQELTQEYSENIPTTLDIVAFSPDENEDLKDILMRKHNGPQDGVGTAPWGKEAKDRFTGKKSFTDIIETQFESQFGESLSSYVGGSQARTSTERIFNSKPVKEYLEIKDVQNLTSEELDKVKKVADEVKGFAVANKTFLSRINVKTIKNAIIIPLKESEQDADSGTKKQPNVKLAIKQNFAKFKSSLTTNTQKHLGSKYNNPDWLLLDNSDNEWINSILVGLNDYGELTDNLDNRWIKASLLAPAIRVLFESSIKMLMDTNTIDDFPSKNPSVNLEENVNHAHDKFKSQPKFFTQLGEHGIIDNSFTAINAVVNSTTFGHDAKKSNLSSHSGTRHLDIDEVVNLFNSAVLFSLLSEQYADYIKQKAN